MRVKIALSNVASRLAVVKSLVLDVCNPGQNILLCVQCTLSKAGLTSPTSQVSCRTHPLPLSKSNWCLTHFPAIFHNTEEMTKADADSNIEPDYKQDNSTWGKTATYTRTSCDNSKAKAILDRKSPFRVYHWCLLPKLTHMHM